MKFKHLLFIVGLLVFVTALAGVKARIEFVSDDSQTNVRKGAKPEGGGNEPQAMQLNTKQFKAVGSTKTSTAGKTANKANLVSPKPLFILSLQELKGISKDDREENMSISGHIEIRPKWFANIRDNQRAGIKKYKFAEVTGAAIEFENSIVCEATTSYYDEGKAQISIKLRDRDKGQKTKDIVDIHPSTNKTNLNILIDANAQKVFLAQASNKSKRTYLGRFGEPITVKGNLKNRPNVETASLTFTIKKPTTKFKAIKGTMSRVKR